MDWFHFKASFLRLGEGVKGMRLTIIPFYLKVYSLFILFFMRASVLDHPEEKNGLIEVTHSFGSRGVDLSQVQHLIIDPHGSWDVPPVRGVEDHLAQYGSNTVRRHLAVERDLGIPELKDGLLARLPNALAINFRVNRALADPNRRPEVAFSELMKAADPAVQAALMDWHKRGLVAVDEILALVNPNARISLLHSTEIFDYPAPSAEDVKDAASFEAYVDRVCALRCAEFQNCIITGAGDEPSRGDGHFNQVLQRNLTSVGIPFALDNPYATHFGRHLTSDYMRARLDRVNAMDWRKDLLAEGSATDGTFALDRSEPVPLKL